MHQAYRRGQNEKSRISEFKNCLAGAAQAWLAINVQDISSFERRELRHAITQSYLRIAA
jgi:hypothetical protein